MNLAIIVRTSVFMTLSSCFSVSSSMKHVFPLRFHFTSSRNSNLQMYKHIAIQNQMLLHTKSGPGFISGAGSYYKSGAGSYYKSGSGSGSRNFRYIDMKIKSKGKNDAFDYEIPSTNSITSYNVNQLYNVHQWKYKPRSDNQIKYVDYLINPNISIVGGFGPAGSGKTLFACHAAVGALKAGLVDKIIITRPLISVDEEELGFLPGSIANKMDPWTRPIFDILGEFYTANQIHSMVENGVIEISPLAYMRGRTFKRAFIIADEMQNSSPNQMLMMLTRIGEASKLVITGDLKQSDRPGINGLRDFIQKLRGVSHRLSDDGHGNSLIEFVELENCDIQRSPVVARVLSIYAADAEKVNHIKQSDAAIIPKGYEPKSYTL